MSTPVPRSVARQYPDGAHGFRKEKRAQLRALIKAYTDLRVGSAFFPCGTAPMDRIDAQLIELEAALSVANWGK